MAIWPRLAPSVKLGLVLYGGTAIALRLGHRTSIDFDFFTEKSLDFSELSRNFPFLRDAKIIQNQTESLSVLVSAPGNIQDPATRSSEASKVKISFFGLISIGRAANPDRTEDGILEVASPLDLLATKLKVIQQRVEVKDYLDIAALLRAGVKLEAGLGAAAELYSPTFQPNEAVKALTYFEGGDLINLSAEDRSFLVQAASTMRSRISSLGLASRSLSSQDQTSRD
jgi:hypothetical protein